MKRKRYSEGQIFGILKEAEAAARWEAELLFREVDSVYRIDQMPSGSRHTTETLTYAALLTLTVHRERRRILLGSYDSGVCKQCTR